MVNTGPVAPYEHPAGGVDVSTEGRLGARKLRRITALTGIEAVAGWAWSPHYEFRDQADSHYVMNIKTGEWRPVPHPVHYTSCKAARK